MTSRLHDWLDELGIFFRGSLIDAIAKYTPAGGGGPDEQTYVLSPPADPAWRQCFPAPLSFRVSADSPRHAPLGELWAEVSGADADKAFSAALVYLTHRFGAPQNSDSMYTGNHKSRSWAFGHGAISLSCHIYESASPLVEKCKWRLGPPAQPAQPDYAAITINPGWFPELAEGTIQFDALKSAAPLPASFYFDALPGEFIYVADPNIPLTLDPGFYVMLGSGNLLVIDDDEDVQRIFFMPRACMREMRYVLLHPAMNNPGIEEHFILFDCAGLTIPCEGRAMLSSGGYSEEQSEAPARHLADALKLPFVRLESDNY